TPRVVALVFAAPWLRRTLVVFTFTYAYTLGVLSRVEGRVPDLHVSAAVLLNLVCIIVFFQFVQRLSNGLRSSTMMQLVGDRGRAVIEAVYPTTYDPARPESAPTAALPTTPPQVIEYGGRSGVIMAVGMEALARVAREAGAVVELVPQVGDSVCPGDPLF